MGAIRNLMLKISRSEIFHTDMRIHICCKVWYVEEYLFTDLFIGGKIGHIRNLTSRFSFMQTHNNQVMKHECLIQVNSKLE